MKIKHRVNAAYVRPPDPEWAERVEREAEQHTARTEAAHTKAQRRLERAIVKVQVEQAKPTTSLRRVEKLWAVVEQRREELVALSRLMRATPAGSQNRGRHSYRGVGRGEG